MFDVSKSNFEPRLICIQAFNHHPSQSTLNVENQEDNDKRKFYITFFEDDFINTNRYEVNLNNDEKTSIQGRAPSFVIQPTFLENLNFFRSVLNNCGFTIEDLDHFENKDYVKILDEFCAKAKIDVRFNFTISLACKFFLSN